MKKMIGLDFGDRTVGVAVSDGLGITAQARETVWRERPAKLRKTLARIEEIIEEEDAGLIVLGLPLNMDGTEGERAEKTRAFGEMISRRSGLPVVFEDERLTTMQAEEYLEETGVPKDRMKEYVDRVAAQIILQQYMDREGKQDING